MPAFLTRNRIAAFLRENGFPIGDSTIKKLVLPSRGPRGPPVAAWFLSRALYDPDEVLKWAKAQLRPTREKPVPPDQDAEADRTGEAA